MGVQKVFGKIVAGHYTFVNRGGHFSTKAYLKPSYKDEFGRVSNKIVEFVNDGEEIATVAVNKSSNKAIQVAHKALFDVMYEAINKMMPDVLSQLDSSIINLHSNYDIYNNLSSKSKNILNFLSNVSDKTFIRAAENIAKKH